MKPKANSSPFDPIDRTDLDRSTANRPHTTVVLAMSADGKITDGQRSAARFGSIADKQHLETQIAQADGVLFGANTLRAYGTTLRVTQPELLVQRQQQNKAPQPVHIVCSASGHLPLRLRFFQQAVPRWLLTSGAGAIAWANRSPVASGYFENIIQVPQTAVGLDWAVALAELRRSHLQRLVIAGGGELVASLLQWQAIDEIWLTVCPLLLGGKETPSPVAGGGFAVDGAPRLQLINVKAIDQEVFLHYRVLSAHAKTIAHPKLGKEFC